MFPGVTSQINYLHSIPFSESLYGEPNNTAGNRLLLKVFEQSSNVQSKNSS